VNPGPGAAPVPIKEDRLIPLPTDALKLRGFELISTPAKLTPRLSKYATPAPGNGLVWNSDWGLNDAPFVSVRVNPLTLASA
jgi:hypothetical protein